MLALDELHSDWEIAAHFEQTRRVEMVFGSKSSYAFDDRGTSDVVRKQEIENGQVQRLSVMMHVFADVDRHFFRGSGFQHERPSSGPDGPVRTTFCVVVRAFRLAALLDRATQDDAEPQRRVARNDARKDIQAADQPGAVADRAERFILERRECRVCTDESDRNQESPVRMNDESVRQQRSGDSHDQASADVDDEGAPGEPGGDPRLNHRGDLVSGERTESAAHCNHRVAIQSPSSASRFRGPNELLGSSLTD